MRLVRLIAAVCIGALVGCGGGRESESLNASTLNGFASRISFKKKPKQQPIVVTRALVDATPGAVLEARSETLDQTGYLTLVTVREDEEPGRVTVWQSGDNAQLVFRNGVLVTTRGLGFSLLSSNVAGTVFALQEQEPARVQRQMTLLRGDNSRLDLSFRCDLSNLGKQSIYVVDQNVETTLFRETCRSGRDGFTNEYWIETETGYLRKSRQWAGPEIGYFAILILKV